MSPTKNHETWAIKRWGKVDALIHHGLCGQPNMMKNMARNFYHPTQAALSATYARWQNHGRKQSHLMRNDGRQLAQQWWLWMNPHHQQFEDGLCYIIWIAFNLPPLTSDMYVWKLIRGLTKNLSVLMGHVKLSTVFLIEPKSKFFYSLSSKLSMGSIHDS